MSVEELLRRTLAEHEPLADPLRAQEIARTATPAPRRWPTAVVAGVVVAVLVAAGGASYLSTRGHGPEPTHRETAARTDAGNRAQAQRESDWLIAHVPLPPGSRRRATSPTAGMETLNSYLGGADMRISRSGWWTVPLTPTAFMRYVATHVPDGLSAPVAGGGGSSASGWLSELDLTGRGTAAYSSPTLMLQFQGVDHGSVTAVRADTFVGTRLARSPASRITAAVSSIDVARTVSHPGPKGTSRVDLPTVHLEDPNAVARLVGAFDDLYGSVATPIAASCPAPIDAATNRLTFHTADGDLTAEFSTYCFGQVTVSRDGQALPPTLDPGELPQVVTSVAGEPSAPPPASGAVSGLRGHLLFVGGPAPGRAKAHAGKVHVTGNGVDQEVDTAADGSWHLAVPPGRYAVRASSPDYGSGQPDACRSAGSGNVVVRAHEVTTTDVYCQIP